jgi:hypothetical protein
MQREEAMNGRTWKRYLGVLVVLLVVLAACGGDINGGVMADCHPMASSGDMMARCQAEKFWGAIPERTALEIRGLSALVGPEVLAGGQRQDWAQSLVREASGAVNPALDLVNEVTEGKGPRVSGSTAIWEPLPGMATSTHWRFTVTKAARCTDRLREACTNATGGAWEYRLEGKQKTDPDSAFVTVLSGQTERGAGADDVSGSVVVDWDAAATLPEHGSQTGTATLTFTVTEEGHTVDAEINRTYYNTLGPVAQSRSIRARSFHGGPGEVTRHQNNRPDYGLAIPSWSTNRIRWDASAAGRMDNLNGGGEQGGLWTSSTCWDSTLQQTFSINSTSPNSRSGEESKCPASFPFPNYLSP